MSFLVVGRGIYGQEKLIDLLYSLGYADPANIIRQAEKGRAICGNLRILAMRGLINA
ncbi:hypothetical protein [Paenibacillus gyeongsangnamensis]|uniref:hypothetical protein n=1 Tax=Paenibacillus gyeongsangnamensis TaxID=3388067 RepID=UPI0022B8FFC4|nr:hypothetical protein [Paenibacillus filicis]